MPPLPADSIHARACKLKCEKILTRPFATMSSDELEQKCSPFLQTEEGALTTYLDFNYYIVIFFSNSFLKSSILLASIKIGVIEEKTTGFLE